MPSLEHKIRGIINKKKETLKEDASGVVSTSQHVQPDWEDLGSAPTDPHGALPDYGKSIIPGQAALPPMHPTPGVGTTTGAGAGPSTQVHEEKDRDDEDDNDDDDNDNAPETVKEDNTADQENQRQYDKIKQGDKMKGVGKDDEDDDDDDDKDKKDIKEDIDALFAGEKLTSAFKKKASTIFEAAVNYRVNAIVENEMQRLVTEYAQEVENIKTQLTEQVDQYLNFVSGEWLNENALAIDTGIRNELVEDFIVGLKHLFTENFIDVPADKVDVLEAMAERVEELETSLNEQLQTNTELTEANISLGRHMLITEAAKGLTEAQADKFVQLSESIDFKDEDSFTESLKVLKENQIVTKTKRSQNLTEESNVAPIEKPGKKTEMSNILESLKKTSR